MQKFTKQLPKDDLKKFAKEVGKKLVASDFRNGRIDDPTKISEKQEKKVKAYVRQFFEKAVEKKKELDKRKKEKEKAKLANGLGSGQKVNGNGKEEADAEGEVDDEKAEDIDLTPSSPSPPGAPSSPRASTTPSFTESSPELKRKRTGEETPGDDSDCKRLKEEDFTPPPPPPPPPAEGMPDETEMEGMEPVVSKEETEEEKELRRQEEDLMRENEEAIKMEQDGSLKTAENAHHHLNLNCHGLKSDHGNGDEMEGVEDTNGIKRERESLMGH
jgi:[histone H3]-lysine36 N-trimethyltransferase